ncbi:MAG: endonuclease III [Methanoregulaceae archaeon]|nr:endonuclease III [Methanoregulaceae archaeon]
METRPKRTCMDKKKARRIFTILSGRYPDRWARERYSASPFEVLITTILSAQTTDKSVDAVRDDLFSRFPDPESLSNADIAKVEEIIHSTGFFHMKAKHIIAASRSLVERFSGTVPATMDDLLTIPGVGRKTANIVLYHAFGKNMGVAVDTHVFRLAGRLGFSDSGNADGIEKDLMRLFPEKDWGVLTDVLISHGRAICTARKPACGICPVSHLCRYYSELVQREK